MTKINVAYCSIFVRKNEGVTIIFPSTSPVGTHRMMLGSQQPNAEMSAKRIRFLMLKKS